MKKLIYLSGIVLLSFNLLGLESLAPDFRLVVTGGLHGIHAGHEAFYNSPLFRLGKDSPLQIKDAQFEAFGAGETVYFSSSKIDLDKLIQAIPNGLKKQFTGVMASQLFGIKMTSEQFADFSDDPVRRELGAVSHQLNYETVIVGKSLVYAIDMSLDQKGVYWASKLDEIKKVNSIYGTGSNSEQYFFFPRDFRSTKRTFELVDQLLKKENNGPARYVDLGNTLTGNEHENLDDAIEMSSLLQSRKPAALALGRYDLNVVSQLPEQSAYIAALEGINAPAGSRRVKIGNSEIRFLALGDISDLASSFLGSDLKPLSTRQSIERVKFNHDDLVIGLSENRDSAAQAIEYPLLDLVLSLSDVRGGSLPSIDDINLSGNELSGVRTVAPLVRVSSSDVTEVSVWLSGPGQIKRISIRRHPIVGNASKQDTFYEAALEKKNWNESDFEKILSNVLLNAYPKSELVIIEKRISPTPIDSTLPMPLAEALIAPMGRSIEINLGGYYLNQILKAIKKNQFDIPVVVTNTLEREILPIESYRLVVSEKVLAAISDFIARESLFASSSNPSSSLQVALQESNKEAYKLLAELRKRENKSSDSADNIRTLLRSSPSLTELVRAGILEKSPLNQRPDRSILIFEISDLDVGLKMNAVNDTLTSWQSGGKGDSKLAFDENRFWDPKYINLLLNAKVRLDYIMPRVETGLVTSIKYYQPNEDKPNAKTLKEVNEARPGKDSVKLEGELRLPVPFYVSPLFRLTYETQIWPNSWFTAIPEQYWPRKVHDMRLFLGVSKKPKLSYELFRVGALLGYDFSRHNANQSFGAGFELGGAYRYNWRYFGFKIDSAFRKLFPIVDNPDAGRMGVVWLTDLSVSVPIVAGFSVSAMSSLNIGERMDTPWTYGMGAMFGMALSYGNQFKWLP